MRLCSAFDDGLVFIQGATVWDRFYITAVVRVFEMWVKEMDRQRHDHPVLSDFDRCLQSSGLLYHAFEGGDS